jgi:hypothetical protein
MAARCPLLDCPPSVQLRDERQPAVRPLQTKVGFLKLSIAVNITVEVEVEIENKAQAYTQI